MTAQWFWPIIASAISLGFYDIAKKRALRDNPVMPVLFFATLSGTIFFCTGTLAAGTWYSSFVTGWRNWYLVMIKSCIVASSWVCVYYAMRELPITLASPLRASSPLWTCFGGILLFHEIPTFRGTAGMIAVFAGYYVFSVAGKLEGFTFRHKGVKLLLLGTLLGAASALYDKFLLNIMGVPRQMMQLHFSLDLVLILGLAWAIRSMISPSKHKFRWHWTIPLTGILLIAADYLYFYALSMPEVKISVLSLIRRSNCIVTFAVGGWWIFKDKNLIPKAVAMAFIIVGLFLLSR